MTRLEMINAVERLFTADGSEEDLYMLRQRLKEVLPHSNISDLIYYPETELGAEQIVEEAIRRESKAGTLNFMSS